MDEMKTRPSSADVNQYLAAIEHNQRRADAQFLLPIFEEITECKAVLWGGSIIGFGQYHYRYASGREGDWPVTGFSPRKQNLSIYIMPGFLNMTAWLSKLGKHKTSGSCLSINKLADIDLGVLKQIINKSIREMGKIYPCEMIP
ncbi:MAG: hypothetical protein ACI8XC_004198 [Gammaproteobacteria bacterium]|jgi:hypothetical protein